MDSRIADWKIKLVDTVADNASSGKLVIGGKLTEVHRHRPAPGRDGDDPQRRGHRHRRGRRRLGNPARCVAWLANKLATFGASLHADDIVLPGAVHRMVPVQPGDVFRAEFAYLGAVTARFSNGAGSTVRNGEGRPDGRAIDRGHPDRRRT